MSKYNLENALKLEEPILNLVKEERIECKVKYLPLVKEELNASYKLENEGRICSDKDITYSLIPERPTVKNDFEIKDEPLASLVDAIKKEQDTSGVPYVKKEYLNAVDECSMDLSSRQCTEDGSKLCINFKAEENLKKLKEDDSYNNNNTEVILKELHEEIKCRDLICKDEEPQNNLQETSRNNSHINLVAGQNSFSCDICDKSYKRKCHLLQHKRNHGGHRPFVCPICLKDFVRKDIMKTHVKTHTFSNSRNPTKNLQSEQFECNYCKKVFFIKHGLQRHIQLTHLGQRDHECRICQKKCGSRSCLKRHMLTHTGERPFVCKICQTGFVRKYDLTSHEVSHTGKKGFNCELCKKGYARKTELNKHIKWHSLNEVKCVECGMAFHLKKDMLEHAHVVHINLSLIMKQFQKKGIEAIYCKICDKNFVSERMLVRHVNYFRTEHEDVVCHFCKHTFSSLLSLKLHIKRLHLDKKPVKCEVCSSSFNTFRQLQFHKKVHMVDLCL